MRYAGVIGFPLGQSISPVFQQAALDHYGLDIRYERWETPAAELTARIAALRAEDHLGANVTVPHKQAVIPLLDTLDETARAIGAVNTIVKSPGGLTGFNTDCIGFLRALKGDGNFDPADKRALLLGAGGVARAVAYALANAGASFIGIAARNPEQARALRAAVQPFMTKPGVTTFVEEWASEPMAGALPTYDLVVNCTPIGMRHGPAERRSPLDGLDINREAFVYDLVYNPRETPLLAQARAAGCRTLDGLTMLVYQGAEAFQRWTGRPAPVEVMRTAAEEAMRNH